MATLRGRWFWLLALTEQEKAGECFRPEYSHPPSPEALR